jgi:acyl-CoA thioester hydrolase
MQEQIERGRVMWVDTDAGGRIHFTAAFRWAEAAETALMRRLGMLAEWGDYPRRHVEAEYVRVLRFEDELETRLRVDAIGRTSITYGWEIWSGDEVCVRGNHTVVRVDGDGRPEAIPDALRAQLEAR